MKQKRFWKWAGLISLICLVLFAFAPVALAFDGRSGELVIIGPNEVIEDDLYMVADEFILNGTIKGDLIVFGRTIEISGGTVEGDLIAVGQTVVVGGEVKDDARIAGMVLRLFGGRVGDDVVAVGASIESDKITSVGGDFIYAGYQALVAGKVAQDLTVTASGLKLSGSVGGDVKAEIGEAEGSPPTFFMPEFPYAPATPPVPMGLTVDEGARINGKLEYTSTEASIPSGVAGWIIPHEPKEAKKKVVISPTGRFLAGHLEGLVSLLLIGLLMARVVPGWTRRAADTLQDNPLPSLGWGVVTIVAILLALLVILVVLILLAEVLGLVKLGSLVLATFALAVLAGLAIIYVAKIVVSFLGGRLILVRLNPNWAEGRIWPSVVGLVIFVILTAIPWGLGGLLNLIAVLLGLGALWLLGRDAYRQRRAAPVVESHA